MEKIERLKFVLNRTCYWPYCCLLQLD